MPAIEPGWDATSCRCRHLHQHARAARLAYPLAVGCRPVSVTAAPCRRARVAFTPRARSCARPCGPRRPRTGVHPSTRAPQPWRRGRAFGPFSCLRRRSPPCLGRPRRSVPAMAMWVVRTVAKRRGCHVRGRPEHTAVHPVVFTPTNRGRRARRLPWRRAGLRRAPVRARLDLHLHQLGLTMRKRYPAQHTRPLIHGTPPPASRRRRCTRAGADHAANAVAPIVRDPSSKHP
jgi:hypothetical protein